jgi:hypothetical protein
MAPRPRWRRGPDGAHPTPSSKPSPDTSLYAGAAGDRVPDHGVMNHYEIRVAGHLDLRRARALGAEDCRRLAGGQTLLVFSSIDRAATYGLIARLRDAGLELVSVTPIAPDESGTERG